MSALVRMKLATIAAGIACLASVNAVAQQNAGQRDTAQARDDVSNRDDARQTDRLDTQTDRPLRDRATTQQRDQIRTTQSTQFGQRSVRAQAGGQNQDVERFLAACLLAKNQAEVELGQFAQQQAQNPQVKQFAQMIIKDHQQLVQQLQQVAGNQTGQSSTRLDSTSQSLSASGQIDAQRQPSDTTRLPGSSGAGQTESPTARDTSAALEAQTRNQNLTARGGSPDNAAIEQLIQIERQIVDRHTEAIREELQQKSGVEFDKCFVGSQVAGHMHMLAALEVIAQQQGQLAQIAQQAQPTVQQHLEHAKQLMKQLEGGARTGGQAERPTAQSPRTQRQ